MNVTFWEGVQSERIGRHTMNILTDERNDLLLSAASAWEIARKFRRGKLHLYDSPDRYVPDRLLTSGVKGLPLELSHALRVVRVDDLHRDPVDRLLVAQATIEQVPLITADGRFAGADIEHIDATV
jgi:PIN domain nuclease of toxin-antitoxin system